MDSAQSDFLPLTKGVPQGSICGPVFFNIFINDIFYFINHSKLYNYADDNTLSVSDVNYEDMKRNLEVEGSALVDWFEINQMEANPGKFQSLAVGKKTHAKNPTFQIQGTDIPCSDEVKLLGVTIDYLLNYDTHISNLCKKTARQINVLKRIGRYLPIGCRKVIYQSFIQSNFNFCPLIWHFCSARNTKKIEQLNFRALKLVYQDFSSTYDDLLNRDKSVSLHLQRQRLIALEVYKILAKQGPSYLHNLISVKPTRYNFRSKNVNVPSVKSTAYGKKSFLLHGAQLWNSLPNDIRNAENFAQFKALIKTWNGSKCRCAMCI